jgi:hypothetical protein
VLLRDIAAASEQLYREKRHDGARSASLHTCVNICRANVLSVRTR